MALNQTTTDWIRWFESVGRTPRPVLFIQQNIYLQRWCGGAGRGHGPLAFFPDEFMTYPRTREGPSIISHNCHNSNFQNWILVYFSADALMLSANIIQYPNLISTWPQQIEHVWLRIAYFLTCHLTYLILFIKLSKASFSRFPRTWDNIDKQLHPNRVQAPIWAPTKLPWDDTRPKNALALPLN